MTRAPWWRRPGAAVGLAGGLYVCVFAVRAAEIVDVEAADTLFAAPVALVAVTYGATGGIVAGLAAAGAFAAAEAADAGNLTWGEVVVRAFGFALLGAFVGAAAKLLEQARAQFSGAFDNAPHGILLAGTDGRIMEANRAASRLLGRDNADLVQATLSSLSHPLDFGTDEAQWAALQAGQVPSYSIERQLAGVDGQAVPVMMAVSWMPTPSEGAAVIVHLVDLGAQRRSEQQLAYLADHDPLTGLFNRHRFDEELRWHLRRAARRGPTGAVLLLDLDHFKYLNDTLGHAVGDRVLRTVALALADRVRAEDVLARLGGDEFAILLPDARTEDEVRTAAADILVVVSSARVTLSADRPTSVADVHVTASVGAVLVPPFSDTDRLLTAADLAMYEAKEAGPSQVRIHSPDSPHAERIRAGFTWGERIRRALAQRRFELHVQPIVALTGTKDPQYEVLLRLPDNDHLWHPAEFLRHAERLGLMADIDRYVIERTIRLLTTLPRHRRPRLEVNLSAASLGDPQLGDWIARTLERHGVLAANLIFEITETVAIANMPLAEQTIRRLRARGCGFALDDFGVGVSSFHNLRELPFDILKIDGEFIREIATNRADQLIVQSMIGTAHGLGKTAIAEYVESAEVADILTRLSCDYAQGQHFGMPRPAEDVLHP